MEDGGTSSRYPSVFYFSIIISNETTHLIGCRVKGERIRLDHILEGKFKPNSFNATYIGEFLSPFHTYSVQCIRFNTKHCCSIFFIYSCKKTRSLGYEYFMRSCSLIHTTSFPSVKGIFFQSHLLKKA